ncbi:sarcosine oxidase subunit gamma [Aliigemmobacter aestuarii]|uniref:Sarcosine oxidase subunit gamma n=1 Tax=Aliigemmobacter aestuarii TaxID=1445661 RepID=A0A4S3MRQ4_9RHOB|nr:sarcosine oxidase subunit gamma family protein [Gemmobacter aestuarii]THD84495.1 sarcosine oxidase subunit gamma [Gemmobacter aestuarii]
MSEPVSALGGATHQGFATIREIGPLGMITLRAKPDVKGLAAAVKAVTGTALPAQRRIEVNGDRAAGWMSPDEYLLILPYADVAAGLAALAAKLKGEHHLAVDVSDARAVFRIEGAKADQVLAKLSPVDLARLEPGELRRSRAAQVAAAFWKDGEGYTLVSFRSVAGYVMGLLTHSAQTGSELA